MHTLLRQIRRSLMQSGANRRYLFYALGEFVLIVGGILVALQINNWNEWRKNRILENQILIEISENLNDDVIFLQRSINGTQNYIKNIKIISTQLENELPYHDSLEAHFGNLQGGFVFFPNTSTYDNLKSLGFNLIRNDTLRGEITYLYSHWYPYFIQHISEVNFRVQWDHVLPQVINNIETKKWFEKAVPNDYNRLTSNHAFKEMLKLNLVVNEVILSRAEATKEHILRLAGMIEKSLNQLEKK